MNTLATFGEILLRLNPPGHQRLSEAHEFEVSVAGAEANVAVACASLGHEVFFLSAIPDNDVAATALRHLNFWGVRTDRVMRSGRRIGLYYLEKGFGARPANVIYDREHSSIAEAPPELYDWPRLLAGCEWFHTTGITAAVSESAACSAAAGLKVARAAGLRTSFDLNFRRKLWSAEQARATVEALLADVDLFITSPDQASELFGLRSVGSEEAEFAEDLAADAVRKLRVRNVAVTLRKTENQTHFRAAVFADADATIRTRWFRCDILEPVGGGDAFSGGLIAALMEGRRPLDAAEFAVAAACFKHTMPGDFIKMKREEIDALVRGGCVRGVVR